MAGHIRAVVDRREERGEGVIFKNQIAQMKQPNIVILHFKKAYMNVIGRVDQNMIV